MGLFFGQQIYLYVICACWVKSVMRKVYQVSIAQRNTYNDCSFEKYNRFCMDDVGCFICNGMYRPLSLSFVNMLYFSPVA